MFFGLHPRATPTGSPRLCSGSHLTRAFVSIATIVATLSLGQLASATPVLSIQFDSITVTASGSTPTSALVTAYVVNSGSALAVNALSTEYSVTASGTLNPALLTLTAGTVSNPGVFMNGSPNFTINGTNGWGIDQNPTPTSSIASGTSNIVKLLFTVPAGVTAGSYTINFLTDLVPGEENPFRSFSNTTTSGVYPYADGNNGSPTGTGVITVVPEPTVGAGLATATLLMAGVGIAKSRMGRRDRKSDVVSG